MPHTLFRLISTSFLIVFLIGGGRVCGCEVLSWVGVEVHQHDNESPCSHHHHHHVSDTPTEQEHDDDGRDHSEPDHPSQERDCCELALKSHIGEIPKCLEQHGQTIGDQLDGISSSYLLLQLNASGLPVVVGRFPPGSVQNVSRTRVFQQRFNV